jgi:hypothetical protein
MVSDFFTTAIEKDFAAVEHSRTEDNDYGYGRIESRICYSVHLKRRKASLYDEYREKVLGI